MVGHGGSSAGSYLADPTSPIPSHCASIVVTSTVRVNMLLSRYMITYVNNALMPEASIYNMAPINSLWSLVLLSVEKEIMFLVAFVCLSVC